MINTDWTIEGHIYDQVFFSCSNIIVIKSEAMLKRVWRYYNVFQICIYLVLCLVIYIINLCMCVMSCTHKNKLYIYINPIDIYKKETHPGSWEVFFILYLFKSQLLCLLILFQNRSILYKITVYWMTE